MNSSGELIEPLSINTWRASNQKIKANAFLPRLLAGITKSKSVALLSVSHKDIIGTLILLASFTTCPPQQRDLFHDTPLQYNS